MIWVITPYLIAVVGSSESGKTRLIGRLIPLLNKRGLKVGTIKHAHDRIDLDKPGKDSWRCLRAGAEVAAVVGPRQILTVRKQRVTEDRFTQALKEMPAELDLILAEGFHEARAPQIAVADPAGRIRGGRYVIAVVSDRPFDRVQGGPVHRPVRRFRTCQIRELAAFIDEEWTRQWEISRTPFQGSSSVAA